MHGKRILGVTLQPDGLGVPTSRVSVAWMAAVKPHGLGHAALGVGSARSSTVLLKSYFQV